MAFCGCVGTSIRTYSYTYYWKSRQRLTGYSPNLWFYWATSMHTRAHTSPSPSRNTRRPWHPRRDHSDWSVMQRFVACGKQCFVSLRLSYQLTNFSLPSAFPSSRHLSFPNCQSQFQSSTCSYARSQSTDFPFSTHKGSTRQTRPTIGRQSVPISGLPYASGIEHPYLLSRKKSIGDAGCFRTPFGGVGSDMIDDYQGNELNLRQVFVLQAILDAFGLNGPRHMPIWNLDEMSVPDNLNPVRSAPKSRSFID
jgi:hypothetical protein